MVDVLLALGPSEKIIDLLRHLPDINSTDHEVYWDETLPINYLRDSEGHFRRLTAENCRGRGKSFVMFCLCRYLGIGRLLLFR